MTKQTPHWVVSEFDSSTDTLIAEHPLMDIAVEDLRDIFEQGDDADMFDSWPLDQARAAQLAPFLKQQFTFRSDRSFFVECHGGE